MADKLHKKLTSYVALLNRSSDVVEELYRFRQRFALPAVNPCCLMDPSVLMMDNHFGTEITNSTTCDTAPLSLPKGVFSPGPNLTDVFRKNLESRPSIKWQYFVSAAGIHTEYPAYSTVRKWSCRHVDDLRHRDIYLATVQPYTKHVVIVIDHGNSLSPKQLVTAKAVAKYVLSTLSHHDRVGLIGLSGKPKFPQSDKCLSKEMAYATYETKYHFGRFIDSLQKAPTEALIVYVSRGLLSSIADARPVLETIASGHRTSGHRVVINTYAVIDDGKPIMYETSFLRDIAELNFVKYNVPGVPSPELRGSHTVTGVVIAFNISPLLLLDSGSSGENKLTLASVVESPDRATNLVEAEPAEEQLSEVVYRWTRSLNLTVCSCIILTVTTLQCRPDALHSPSDAVVAVIGMDLTLGYFYKLLTVNMEVCEQDKIACFIVDDSGYLIAHPSLMEPTLKSAGLEQQHITRKEPLVVSDIANHKGFMKKKECNHYGDWTVQRFYKLNTSLEGILTNSVHGEHCAKYQVDRLCLNCHRMEQRDCECPCECPLQMNLCTGDLAHNEDRDCSGVLGCEWCSVDMDGETALKTPFCHEQPKCFGGVLGARTPYADEII
ncbi:hypothetical protein V5799_030742, partial [Amblyomma americanum]